MPNPARDVPLFSIVSAVYNVDRYLDAFIGSLEAQSWTHAEFEVIAVDDGSTDGSHARLERWASESDISVTILTKENGGQASARNLGLDHARGEWVTFLDPDDTVGPHYLRRVATFLADHPECDMVATNRIIHLDSEGTTENTHPLKWMFREGDVLRDLSVDVDCFHGSAPSSFMSRLKIESLALRFDTNVRPNFEDGQFCCRYLLHHANPQVGFLRSARYYYRKRGDSSSTLQTGLLHPGRYTAVMEQGYLAVLEEAVSIHGVVPDWLQNYMLYELSFYFSIHDNHGITIASRPEIVDRFHTLMAKVVAHLRPDLVEAYEGRTLRDDWRAAIQGGYRGEAWSQDVVEATTIDEDQQLVRLSHYSAGEPPDVEFVIDGEVREPTHQKVRAVTYHGRHLLNELIAWVPADTPVRVHLNRRSVRIRCRGESTVRYMLRPIDIQRMTVRSRAVADFGKRTVEGNALLEAAGRRKFRRKYADAWVFMDRVHDADDSGEYLFRWVRDNKPDVNAWFVVEEGSSDWERLKRSRHSRRLVAHGSDEWKMLLLNARHLVSSHADKAVIAPLELEGTGNPWRVTFLQHGVIKDDLSTWLNSKPLEVFVTSTQQEFDSIAGDGTTYNFTTRETALTGLPRFDALWRAGQQVPPGQRDLLLVAPTWRNWILPPLTKGTQQRAAYGPEFFESDFLQRWMELLKAVELEALCDRHGLTLAFLPHPNLQQALPDMDLPPHVVPYTYDQDVRRSFARARALVTDYSSVAFNMAYIDRPVIYYQFDRDRVLGGDHVGVGGYFDYERDGFGPVAETSEDALARVIEVVDSGPHPATEYRERIDATFPTRDGRCSERTYDAIVSSTATGGQAVDRPA